MPMSSTRQALVLAAASLLVLAVGLLALELVFGNWLRDGSWSDVERMNVVRNRSVEYDVRHIHGPDAPPVRYSRDRYGLRGPCTEPSSIRLVTLGGSTTDQVYVADGQTWQDRLQQHMTRALGRPWCIANAGVDGHSTFGHIAALERWLPLVPGLAPDYVLFYVGINDAAFRTEPARLDPHAPPAEGAWETAKRQVRNNSALYRLVRLRDARGADTPVFAAHRLLSPTPADYGATSPAADIDELVARGSAAFRDRFATLMRLVRERGARPICVSQPSLVYRQAGQTWVGLNEVFVFEGRRFNGLDYQRSIQALNGVMAQECQRAGGHYIDLESQSFEPGQFYDAVHMNAAGAARVGDLLFEAFKQLGVGGQAVPSMAVTASSAR